MSEKRVRVRFVNGKVVYDYETTSQKPTVKPKSREIKKPGKLETKVKTTRARQKREYVSPHAQAQNDMSGYSGTDEEEYAKPDTTDYMSQRRYQKTLALYELVTNDEKNAILRKYGGNLPSATKEIEELDEERKKSQISVVVTPKAETQTADSGGNGSNSLEGKTLVDYDPTKQDETSGNESAGGKSAYRPIYPQKRTKPRQRGIPKVDNTGKSSPELPEVEGVLAPDDPRYVERLRMLHSIPQRSTIQTKKTKSGKEEKVVPGLDPKFNDQTTLNPHHIMETVPGETEKVVDSILSGEKLFTMSHSPGIGEEETGSNWKHVAKRIEEKGIKPSLVTVDDS